MQIAVVQFPGSNCERETALAIKRANMEPVPFLWNEPKAKLQEMDGFIIIGGFSYEDRSRAGIISALDPVMLEIAKQAALGKPVLGICNGAQILVETGLVPGLENNKVALALTDNKRIADHKIQGTGYFNDWIHMRVSDQHQRNAFTRHLTDNDVLHVPIAHAQGRFVISDALLAEMQNNGLNVFQYCNVDGDIIDEFPVNPNGSVNNIAAVSNKAGNVMAMMPHPERTDNGDAIFKSMHDYIKQGHYVAVEPLHYYPRQKELKPYQAPATAKRCVVELVITDNEALTVQNTLHKIGMPVAVKREICWEVECDGDVTWEKIKKSGVLFNDRKERIVASRSLEATATTQSLLVHPKEDFVGQQKQQTLQDHFHIEGIQSIKRSVLWHFTSEDQNTLEKVLQTNIVANPYVHECYRCNTEK